MADRSVIVRIAANVAGYKASLVDAAAATKKFGTDVVNHTKSVSTELAAVKGASTLAGGSLLGLAALAVTTAASFDKSMSGVQAVTGATAGEMEALRTAAINAGQATVYSAQDAAQAEAELAKAGIKTSDILGGALSGSLSLAAAGQLNLADAATISAQAMNTFGLQGKDVGHIADVLAAGANKSAADVSQLGLALQQGGLLADQTGLSLEDTVGVLSAFADRALIGSDAGTSLKTMLQRLTPQSQQASDEMNKLGIHAYDAQGKFVGLATFAQNLKDSLSKLTPEARNSALQIIFGTDAIRGATILYSLGAKGVNDYTNAVDDSGAASRMAATQLDNLAGDWEQLTGSIQTDFIQAGSSANGLLREIVQSATALANGIGGLPTPILGTALAVTTAGGAFLVAAPRVVAFNAAMADSPALARAAKVALSGLGLTTAVVSVVALWQAFQNLDAEMAAAEDQFNKIGHSTISQQGLEDLKKQIQDYQQTIADPGFVRQAKDFWNVVTNQSTDYTRTVDDLARVQDLYDKLSKSVGDAADTLGVSTSKAFDLASAAGVNLNQSTSTITSSIVAYARAAAGGSVASHNAASAMDVLNDATATAADRLKALQQQWDATTGGMLDASDAEIAAQQALDDMTKSLKDNGNAWKITKEEGRANQSQLNDSIRGFEKMRESLIQNGTHEDVANAKMVAYLRTLRDELPKSAKTARAEVQKLIDKYSQVPAKKNTKFTADTSQAMTAIQKIRAQYAEVVAFAQSHPIEAAAHYGLTPPIKKAGGGPVVGPGTNTSDSVPLWGSNGEWMMQASAVDKYGPSVMAAINAGTWSPAPARMAAPVGGSSSVVNIASGAVVVNHSGGDNAVIDARIDAAFHQLVRMLRAS